jgi:hypothetical protein
MVIMADIRSEGATKPPEGTAVETGSGQGARVVSRPRCTPAPDAESVIAMDMEAA